MHARRQVIVGVVLVMLTSVTEAFAAILVEDGEAWASIVLSDDADDDLALAARELQAYVSKSTGVVGDLDPINYIYMTRDLERDANTLEQDTSAHMMNRPLD